MTAMEYKQAHNITTRPVTAQDRAAARTDYQREADWIISVNGEEYYSKSLSMKEFRLCVAMYHQRNGY